MRRLLLPSFVAALVLAACAKEREEAAPAAAAPPDTAALRAELAPLADAYRNAILAGDAKALNALYTDDATVEIDGAPTVTGRAAIMAADSASFAMGKPSEWTSTVRSTAALGNGNVAQTGSWNDASPAPGGKTMRRVGRWVASMTKGSDGQWRIGYVMAMIDSTTTK
jgi:uncharacterized protein (TIGR02246 family)